MSLKFVLDDAVSSQAEEAARILQELENERREREGDSNVDHLLMDVESDRVETGESDVDGFVDVAEGDEE